MEGEDITRDDEIKFNLEVYQQPISECVDVTHLLMSLSTYSNVQRRQLTQLARTNPIDATKQAINIILNVETPGIGTELMQSLQDEYPKVLKFLCGDPVKCDNNYRKIIELFSKEITNRIEPTDLLPRLLKHNVLVHSEYEEIQAENESSGKSHAMWTTLLYLHRHQEEWFKYFLMSLMDIDHEDVALKLDSDLVEKIKIQRNEEKQLPSDSDIADEDDVVENVYEDYESGHYDVELNDPLPLQANTSLQVDSFSTSVACTKNSDSCNKLLIEPVIEGNSKDLRQFVDEDNQVTNLKQIVEEETHVTNSKHLFEDEGHGTDLKQSVDEGYPLTDMIQEVNKISEEDEGHQTLMKQISVDAERTDSPDIVLTSSEKEKTLGSFMSNLDVDTQRTFHGVNNLNLLSHEEKQTPIMKLDEECRHETKANKNKTKESIKKYEKELNISVEQPGKHIIPALRQEQADNKADFYQRKSPKPDDELLYKRDITPLPLFQRDVTPVPPGNLHYSNTDTDQDTLENVPDHSISLYNYQRKWAERGADGTNLILIAPTNSGKTRVACKIIDTMFNRLKDAGKMGKVVFIVDRDELASQQGNVLAEQLPGYRTKVVTGPVQQNHNQFLKDYVHRRDILVVTAQVLLNCLKAKEISGLDVFNLLLFDECHHTDKKHPFKELMDIYFEMKINNTSIPPQVIGLTATIGVAGSLDQISALEHMKSIAANLDATALVCPDDQDKIDIKSSIPKAAVCAMPWDKRRTFSQDIHQVILNMNEFIKSNACVQQLDGSDKFMKHICEVPTCIGTSQFQNWLSAFRDGIDVIESDGARLVLNPCYVYLEKYHVAMELFNDARTIDAKKVLEELNASRRRAKVNDAVDEFLLNECQKILDKSYRYEPENPKLLKLSEILTKSMTDNHEARCIVFVKTRLLAQKLKDWMNETDELKIFNAREFLGRATDGNTIRDRKDTLQLFKEGIHKVIIATTVAEEGLDITACNLVIRYEHVTNENSRGQSRGRARADDSRYYVITNIGSWIVEKEEHNAKCEKLMLDLIPRLKECIEKDRNKWEINVMTIQKQAKAQRDIDRLNQARNMITGPIRIHCKNCAAYLCSSNDLRVVAGMHRVIIAPEIREKVLMDESFEVKHHSQQNGTSLGGNVYCRSEKCIFKHRIGGIMEFKKVHFPILILESISFRDDEGKPLFFKKKWGKIPIQIEPIDIMELYYLTLDNYIN